MQLPLEMLQLVGVKRHMPNHEQCLAAVLESSEPAKLVEADAIVGDAGFVQLVAGEGSCLSA